VVGVKFSQLASAILVVEEGYPCWASHKKHIVTLCCQYPLCALFSINYYFETMTQITVDTAVNAPMKTVWKAYTTPEDIMAWNAASDDWCCPKATVDLRNGGSFVTRMEAKDGSAGFEFGGTYEAVTEHERIEYKMEDGRRVTVEFSENGSGVTVKVTFDAETENSIDLQRSGWQSILDNLAQHCATL